MNFDILKPNPQELQKRQLKKFLHSSKQPIKNFFHLKDPSFCDSSQITVARSKSMHTINKFDKVLFISPLNGVDANSKFKAQNNPPLGETSFPSIQPQNHPKTENGLKKYSTITKSFLIASNNNIGSFRTKNEVFLGQSKNKIFTYLKYSNPQTLEKAIKIDKKNKYPLIERKFSYFNDKSRSFSHKGKLFINRFPSKKHENSKISLKQLKENLIIVKNKLTETNKVFL